MRSPNRSRGFISFDVLVAFLVVMFMLHSAFIIYTTLYQRAVLAQENQVRYNKALALADYLVKWGATDQSGNSDRFALYNKLSQHEIDDWALQQEQNRDWTTRLQLNDTQIQCIPLLEPPHLPDGDYLCVTRLAVNNSLFGPKEKVKLIVCVR